MPDENIREYLTRMSEAGMGLPVHPRQPEPGPQQPAQQPVFVPPQRQPEAQVPARKSPADWPLIVAVMAFLAIVVRGVKTHGPVAMQQIAQWNAQAAQNSQGGYYEDDGWQPTNWQAMTEAEAGESEAGFSGANQARRRQHWQAPVAPRWDTRNQPPEVRQGNLAYNNGNAIQSRGYDQAVSATGWNAAPGQATKQTARKYRNGGQ